MDVPHGRSQLIVASYGFNGFEGLRCNLLMEACFIVIALLRAAGHHHGLVQGVVLHCHGVHQELTAGALEIVAFLCPGWCTSSMVWCRCALRCRSRARARGVLARHAEALHRWLVAGRALNNHVDLLAQRPPWLRAGRVLGCRARALRDQCDTDAHHLVARGIDCCYQLHHGGGICLPLWSALILLRADRLSHTREVFCLPPWCVLI